MASSSHYTKDALHFIYAMTFAKQLDRKRSFWTCSPLRTDWGTNLDRFCCLMGLRELLWKLVNPAFGWIYHIGIVKQGRLVLDRSQQLSSSLRWRRSWCFFRNHDQSDDGVHLVNPIFLLLLLLSAGHKSQIDAERRRSGLMAANNICVAVEFKEPFPMPDLLWVLHSESLRGDTFRNAFNQDLCSSVACVLAVLPRWKKSWLLWYRSCSSHSSPSSLWGDRLVLPEMAAVDQSPLLIFLKVGQQRLQRRPTLGLQHVFGED